MIHQQEHELCRAVNALYQLKVAAFGALEDLDEIDPIADFSKLLVGTGLTAEHVASHAAAVAFSGIEHLGKRPSVNLTEDEKQAVLGMCAGAWGDGLLVGLKLADLRRDAEVHPPKPPDVEEMLRGFVQRLFPDHTLVFVPWMPDRPPLWTRYCEGVSEAARDRRRAARRSRFITSRSVHQPDSAGE